MPTSLTRRHLLAGASATAAVAAMPAAAIAAVEETAPAVTYMDPALLAWKPGRMLWPRELVMIADRLHVVMIAHVAEDEPSERYLSRALRIDEDGRFREEDA